LSEQPLGISTRNFTLVTCSDLLKHIKRHMVFSYCYKIADLGDKIVILYIQKLTTEYCLVVFYK